MIRKGDKLLLEVKEDQDDYQSDSLITDITGLLKDLATLKENLRFFMRMDDAKTVYWMEASGQFRSKSLQLYAVPVDVSAQLKDMFFDKRKALSLLRLRSRLISHFSS